MKRALDIIAAGFGLLLAAPFIGLFLLLIWLQDFGNPFYIAPRMAKGGGTFSMVKLRSMVVRADRTGVVSTAKSDVRITPAGRLLRACKMDEIVQLWNVLKGEMSLVGPRPQVPKDAARYTAEERRLLTIRPGITDLASIVFADEGDVLAGEGDPELAYDRIIRPWKSRLALLYVDRGDWRADLRIIWLTAVGIFSRRRALDGVQRILCQWRADELVRRMADRRGTLVAYPPPGAAASPHAPAETRSGPAFEAALVEVR